MLALYQNRLLIIIVIFVVVYVCLPLTRKQIVSLSFKQDVRTRLGVAISEVSGPPLFHRCLGGVPLSALPKDTTSELVGLFSTTYLKRRSSSREAMDTIF